MDNKRINANMDMVEIIATMSEGNPGAATCMIQMFQYDFLTTMRDILWFDSMQIYGSKIYMIWNDCCKRDISKFKNTMEYLRSGKISKEEIHKNLNNVRAVPFI